MSQNNYIHITEPSWGSVKNQLRPILGTHFDDAQREVLAGRERVFKIDDAAIVLLRAEGAELVIAGFVGCIERAAPVLFQRAVENGFRSIRVHATRRGELRLLNQLGYRFKLVKKQRCTARNCTEFELRMEL